MRSQESHSLTVSQSATGQQQQWLKQRSPLREEEEGEEGEEEVTGTPLGLGVGGVGNGLTGVLVEVSEGMDIEHTSSPK